MSGAVPLASSLWLLLAATDALVPLQAHFTPGQIRRIQGGEIVVNVFQESDRTEVVTLGAVRVNARPERLLACARDASCLRAHPDLQQSGRIGLDDAGARPGGLDLDEALLDRLARCTVGKCGLRLTREAIERFATGVTWADAGSAARASALMREVVAGYAADYRTRGDRGLPRYADRPLPAGSAESTAELMGRGLAGLDALPGLRDYLRDFPSAADPGLADQYLLWFREHAYRRTLVGLHHVAVARVPAPGFDLTLVVSKQVYASSFTNSSLEVTAVAAPAGGSDGVLVIASRSRTDIRPSGFNWLERLLLGKVVGGRVNDRLKTLKARLEVH